MLMGKLCNRKSGISKYFEFLIDSGSDYTLIANSHAISLCLNYDEISNPEITLKVANHQQMKGKQIRLVFTLENINFDIPVVVTKQEVECLLGRTGVFEPFNVIFQESKRQVIFQKL